LGIDRLLDCLLHYLARNLKLRPTPVNARKPKIVPQFSQNRTLAA
jgi:hypothetical protein